MEFKTPHGFQLKYKSSERRVPLLSQNREIEISTSYSKFGVENLKRVKAGRDKNFTVRAAKKVSVACTNQCACQNLVKQHIPHRESRLKFLKTEKPLRSQTDIIVEQVIWNCNKKLLFY